MKNILCPCKSGLKYKVCCGPFHEGKNPNNAGQLVRARYSAYSLKLLKYIVNTTYPLYAPLYNFYEFDENKWMEDLESVLKDKKFIDLKILNVASEKNKAIVIFRVKFIEKDKVRWFLEKSFFEKVNEKWLYKFGNVSQTNENVCIKKIVSKILPISYITDSVFHEKKQDILKIDDELKEFVERMKITCTLYNGAGLAASQVHSLKNLFIMRKADDYDVLINPKILDERGESEILEEACISIPNLSGEVSRKNEVVLEYMDMEGDVKRKSFFSFQAKVCMHEVDHLKGIFFIDRMKKEDLKKIEPALKDLKNKIGLLRKL